MTFSFIISEHHCVFLQHKKYKGLQDVTYFFIMWISNLAKSSYTFDYFFFGLISKPCIFIMNVVVRFSSIYSSKWITRQFRLFLNMLHFLQFSIPRFKVILMNERNEKLYYITPYIRLINQGSISCVDVSRLSA